jgi:hypothetical protein
MRLTNDEIEERLETAKRCVAYLNDTSVAHSNLVIAELLLRIDETLSSIDRKTKP